MMTVYRPHSICAHGLGRPWGAANVVGEALRAHGIQAVLTGGSAAAVYSPAYYTSLDADFVLDADDSLDKVATALSSVGFARAGRSRIFVHRDTRFTVDFPRGPLAVGGDYVQQTVTLTREGAILRILSRTDCVHDRLAHLYHWGDYTVLNAAVAVAAGQIEDVDMEAIQIWSEREGDDFSAKFEEFDQRVTAALKLRVRSQEGDVKAVPGAE